MRRPRPLALVTLLLACAAPALADVVPPADVLRRPKLQPKMPPPADPWADSTGTITFQFTRKPQPANVVARQTTQRFGDAVRSTFRLTGSTSDVRVTYDSPANVETFSFPSYAGVALTVWSKSAEAGFWLQQAQQCLAMAAAFQTATSSSTLEIVVRPSKASFQAFRQMRQANPHGFDVNVEVPDLTELTCALHLVPAT